ncbi:DUF6542 domain-containing protein [Rhodococcoides yunnanense]|uniref:DUF6542 domain-containing protein n=1 Tax=Rhodococcoides yunnanense TaxID=278209 RepID=UPI000B1B8B55|nr:DUF6542 domain-containing protein [Rhodococcus yunnanensis]
MVSTSQRARSGVPLDQRSAFATVPGVPAWGAVAIAGGASFLGFVIDAARGTELTSAFSSLYIIGVVASVVLVRYRGLFTAMVQAPLIMFVAVPLSYQYFTDNPGTSLKDILLNVAIPLVNRFPVMLLGTVLALAIGGVRVFLKKQSSHAPAGATSRSVRDRARETRDRARENRARAAESRQRSAAPVAEGRPEGRAEGRAEGRRATSRRADTRKAEGRSTEGRRAEDRRAERGRRVDPRVTESRGADRDPAEGRRVRRERVAPQFDRPAADPYRPETEYASEPPRRAAPRPQQPRVPRPPEVDPYSAPRAATQAAAHIPPHPVPQVRYRDRREP